MNRANHPVQMPAPANQPFQPGIQGANSGSPWKIDHKVAKNLNVFDGKFENYKVWKSMVEDHLVGCNSDWFHVLAVIEKEKTRLTMDRIGNSSLIPGTDARILATELYAFLGTMLTPSLHKRRLRLVGGERGNGMELWRKLFELNEGGGEMCEVAGEAYFFNFPHITDVKDLGNHIDEWLVTTRKIWSMH